MRKSMRLSFGGISARAIILLILPTLLSCSLIHFNPTKAIAEAAVDQFHRQYEAAEYQQIYEQSDQRMKDATTESDFVAVLTAMKRKLGTIQKSNELVPKWAWSNDTGTEVNLTYDTNFKEGKGTEIFVFHMIGDQAILANYEIKSLDLITK
jgi:hypothetical protein